MIKTPRKMAAKTDPEGHPIFRKHLRRSAAEKTAIGRQSIVMKAKLPKGQFGPWLKKCGLSLNVARECIQLARLEYLASHERAMRGD